MQPTFLPGDILLVSSIPYLFSAPKVNDIIGFKDNITSKIFIKRIKEKDKNTFFVCGDNKHDSMDSKKMGWIERKQIVGKVVYLIQNSKVKSQN